MRTNTKAILPAVVAMTTALSLMLAPVATGDDGLPEEPVSVPAVGDTVPEAAPEPIPFARRTVEDDSLPLGVVVTVQNGVEGKIDTIKRVEPTRYGEVEHIRRAVVIPPTEEVVRIGTNADSVVKGIAESVREVESEKKEVARQKEAERIRKAAEEAEAERERLRRLEEQARREREAELGQSESEVSTTVQPSNNISAANPSGAVTTPSENRAYLASIVSGSELACADKLIGRESGYSTTATNPTSGAYGVAQALPAGKYASAGSDWRTNGKTQINWMRGYVQSRYGGFCNALNFHYSNNWY